MMLNTYAPRLQHTLAHIYREAIDIAWPQHCLQCGQRSTALMCTDCTAELPWHTPPYCPRCAHPTVLAANPALEAVVTPHADQTSPHVDQPCAVCKLHPPAFDRTLALFRYEKPINDCIVSLKFHGQLRIAAWLADMAARHITISLNTSHTKTLNLDHPDAIMAIPLHRSRLQERGYNQAHEIARRLSRAWRLPLLRHACTRDQATMAQSHLHAAARRSNVRYAFLAPEPLPYDHILLVDDVITSGATMDACARALKAQGVKRVTALVMARAVMGDNVHQQF